MLWQVKKRETYVRLTINQSLWHYCQYAQCLAAANYFSFHAFVKNNLAKTAKKKARLYKEKT